MPMVNATIPRTNAKFAAIATANDTQRRIATRIESVAAAVTALLAGLNDIRDRLPDPKGAGNENGVSGEYVDRLCASIERRDHESTARIAALCAAGFSTSGDIDGTTNVGKAIEEGGKPFKLANLRDIAGLADKPQNRRKFAASVVLAGRTLPGLAQRLTEEDVSRFIDLAPALLESMTAPSAAPLPKT